MGTEKSKIALDSINSQILKRSRKIYLVIILVIILTITISLALYQSAKKTNTLGLALSVCNTSSNIHLLNDAAPLLNPSIPVKLYPIVNQINKLPNYIKDPNCDYVLVNYWLNYSSSKTKPYLSDLKTYYNPSVGYSSAISKQTSSLATLDIKFKNLVSNEAQINKNIMYVKDPTK